MPAAASPPSATPSLRTCSPSITRAAFSFLPQPLRGTEADDDALTRHPEVLSLGARQRGLP